MTQPVPAAPVSIAMFNHKGGVSKTTTTFNLGWKLAEQGKKVVMVDADPQCNLTGMVLGYTAAADLGTFYTSPSGVSGTIRSGLVPAFEARPEPIRPVPLVEVAGRDGLFLLQGDLRLEEYETTLGIAQELSGAIGTLQNLPGSLTAVVRQSAAAVDVDIIILDMSPGLGPVNQNLVSTADYLIMPTAPDFFSVMAVDSLARVLPRWRAWATKAAEIPALQTAAYPFPEPKLKTLGLIVQKFRPRGGSPAVSFQQWIDALGDAVRTRLSPAFAASGLLLDAGTYSEFGVGDDLGLAQIAEFNSLIAMSQRYQRPIFALTAEQLGVGGAVQENWTTSRDSFDEQFSSLAKLVTNMIAAA